MRFNRLPDLMYIDPRAPVSALVAVVMTAWNGKVNPSVVANLAREAIETRK